MKRISLLIYSLFFLSLTFTLSSQEIQFHFDPRHALHSDVAPRNYLTVTSSDV